MREIVKVLLQEGIGEETIHEVLNVIEENYEVINELLPASQENVMKANARRKAAYGDKDVTQERADRAKKDWDKNYKKHGLKASKNWQIKQDIANRAKDDHAEKREAFDRNQSLTFKWQKRHPDKDWENPDLDLSKYIENAKKSLEYDKEARKEEDKKFPTYDMKTDKVKAAKKEDKFHPKSKPETRDIERAHGIDDVDIRDKVDALEKLHNRRNNY